MSNVYSRVWHWKMCEASHCLGVWQVVGWRCTCTCTYPRSKWPLGCHRRCNPLPPFYFVLSFSYSVAKLQPCPWGGDNIIKKEILNYSIVGYIDLWEKKCLRTSCHQKFTYSTDNFKSKITCIENYIHIYWMQLTKGSKRR